MPYSLEAQFIAPTDHIYECAEFGGYVTTARIVEAKAGIGTSPAFKHAHEPPVGNILGHLPLHHIGNADACPACFEHEVVVVGVKQSGIGREYGVFGLEEYLEPRAVIG